MRVVPALSLRLDDLAGTPVDPRLLPLLEAIAASASLAAAVEARGISYRAAWGILRDWHARLGVPLVLLERGRGARLTAAGRRLLEAHQAAGERLADVLPALAVEIGGTPPRTATGARALVVRAAASHDLALAALAGALPPSAGLSLEISFMGSLHALKEFTEGRVDAAGFHVPIGGRTAWDRAPYLRGLDARRDRLIRFIDREQGLILPRGNPARARGFRDVAAQKLRFINRQRGSGTRLLIDQMLAHDRIDGAEIPGHANEEFTHLAVAATVASGGADAGFGLRAAAAEYGLAFVPLVRERYFVAVRAKALGQPAFARLIDVLRSPLFARVARQFAASGIDVVGTVVGLDAIDAAGRD